MLRLSPIGDCLVNATVLATHQKYAHGCSAGLCTPQCRQWINRHVVLPQQIQCRLHRSRGDDLNQNLMREWPQISETKLQQHVSCDYLRLTLRTQLIFFSDFLAIAKMVDNDLPVALPNRYFRTIDQNCVTGNRLYVGHRNDKGLVYPQKAVNLHQRFHRRDF